MLPHSLPLFSLNPKLNVSLPFGGNFKQYWSLKLALSQMACSKYSTATVNLATTTKTHQAVAAAFSLSIYCKFLPQFYLRFSGAARKLSLQSNHTKLGNYFRISQE